jgi:hypothetical protein
MLARFAFAISLVLLLGSTWNAALALSTSDESITDTRDAYTSGLFIDYLHSVMRMSWR